MGAGNRVTKNRKKEFLGANRKEIRKKRTSSYASPHCTGDNTGDH